MVTTLIRVRPMPPDPCELAGPDGPPFVDSNAGSTLGLGNLDGEGGTWPSESRWKPAAPGD